MKTQRLAAHAVRPGMQVFLAGRVYTVESNLFDRHGKAPYQPLNILICNSHSTVGGYGNGEHFGLLPSTPVTAIKAGAELH